MYPKVHHSISWPVCASTLRLCGNCNLGSVGPRKGEMVGCWRGPGHPCPGENTYTPRGMIPLVTLSFLCDMSRDVITQVILPLAFGYPLHGGEAMALFCRGAFFREVSDSTERVVWDKPPREDQQGERRASAACTENLAGSKKQLERVARGRRYRSWFSQNACRRVSLTVRA